MGYQALYRVWRPQLLKDVVGQTHLTKTLQNALVQNKFSHAYLFSGPRGTGKTSAAKIIAKAINCEKAPVAEPCNECAACVGISNGSIVDVMEIDAASNNGVDEIRDIRDKVKFAPSEVRYKVYIIDEVHMLSTGAFNALLKTLEEPPEHAIFILATTEPHKIPLTIISRCQRFDFKPISQSAMIGRMKEIVEADDVQVEDEALQLIVQAADGGMRDALSLLDQSISFSDDTVQAEAVRLITGAVSREALANVVGSLHNGQASELLSLIDQVLKDGKDPKRFVEDLLYYFRDVLLYKTSPDSAHLMERAVVDEPFKKLSEELSFEWLYHSIETMNNTQQEMKWSTHPKMMIELAVIQLMNKSNVHSPVVQAESSADTSALEDKVKKLESMLSQLQKQGIQSKPEEKSQPQQKRTRKVPQQTRLATGQVKELLAKAEKQKLQQVTSQWPDVTARMKVKSVPGSAWLNDSRPVAAAPDGILLAFQNEMHRDMMDTKFRETLLEVLQEVLGEGMTFITLLHSQWTKLKDEFVQEQKSSDATSHSSGDQETTDPLIDEAVKLVGEDLIEWADQN
ncbi:DNA polymerase III subunit gamma/tau [Alkalicoccobacillus gibsonii]|uniref:DNA polymerase III subunit gamma/tau n=1 Tax=Alkalicoccobacillus gibsonii TaxID=79881 RepID=UPI001931A9C5|nr:DNA polymerase III subunit gamma/tau [Alkalicoccobacillus gibsonii]MBM0067994.1 DNA polymerase III subunit gamma/tau [Alkalicoccobacillus gibsonii]